MTPLEIARRNVEQKETELTAMSSSFTAADGTRREMSTEEFGRFNDKAGEVRAARKAVADIEVADEPTAGSGDGASFRSRGITPSHSLAIHTTEHRFSFQRALQCAANKRFDGVEGDVHNMLVAKRGSKTPPVGILLPLGNEADPEIRKFIHGREAERRALDTSAIPGAIYTTPQLPFIERLYAKTIIRELGATFLDNLGNGKVAIPRQNGSTQGYWVQEGVPVTASNPTIDNVTLTDKTVGVISTLSRKTLFQSSVGIENLLMNDQAQMLAVALDSAAFSGSGTNDVPQGIVTNTAITGLSTAIQGSVMNSAANGSPLTFKQLVAMESQIAGFNADRRGELKYAFTPSMKGYLKTTQRFPGSNSAVTLWADDNTVNGRAALTSTLVPSGLTKGNNANCQAAILGYWGDLLVASWGGIDTVVNEVTGQATGAVTISMLMEADIAVRHNESFAVISDGTLS